MQASKRVARGLVKKTLFTCLAGSSSTCCAVVIVVAASVALFLSPGDCRLRCLCYLKWTLEQLVSGAATT